MTNSTTLPTKEGLIAMINQSREKLEVLVSAFKDEELASIIDEGGWTLKDHLAHLAVWENGVAALLRHESRSRAMGLDESALQSGDYDLMNATIHAHIRELTASEVREMSVMAQQAILAALAFMSDEDFVRPYHEFLENNRGERETWPIFSTIAGNTFGHYEEHLEIMQYAIDRAGNR